MIILFPMDDTDKQSFNRAPGQTEPCSRKQQTRNRPKNRCQNQLKEHVCWGSRGECEWQCFPRHDEVRYIKSWWHYCHLRKLDSHGNTWQAAGQMGWPTLLPQEGAWLCAAENGIHTRKGSAATAQRDRVWRFLIRLFVASHSRHQPSRVSGGKNPPASYLLPTISMLMDLKLHCGSTESFKKKKNYKPLIILFCTQFGWENRHVIRSLQSMVTGLPLW